MKADQDAGTETIQLILSKITTPANLPRISRTRLLDTLHESLVSCTSTIIQGRAGAGKTMLAMDFARNCGRRIAWFKVDASDSDLRSFFEYLVESVRKERPGFGGETLSCFLTKIAAVDDLPLLAEAFVYELLEHGGPPLLIVIDNLHLVYDAEWVVPFFRRLLPLLPADAHMLITGRSLPPAPLWRMRSKQTLCVVEEPTMAFTLPEAKTLFRSYGLAESQADAALEQTRGRAFVLDTMASLLSAQAPVSPLIHALGYTQRRP